LEHLVGAAPEEQGAGAGEAAGARFVELRLRHRPVELALRRGEVPVGRHLVEGHDLAHGRPPRYLGKSSRSTGRISTEPSPSSIGQGFDSSIASERSRASTTMKPSTMSLAST